MTRLGAKDGRCTPQLLGTHEARAALKRRSLRRKWRIGRGWCWWCFAVEASVVRLLRRANGDLSESQLH
jgi:hypothetical protein